MGTGVKVGAGELVGVVDGEGEGSVEIVQNKCQQVR